MGQFAYGFSLTLLHSLWQSALLLLVYIVITLVIKRQLPSAKRNLLYLLLLAQLMVSIITFWIYYSGSEKLYEPLIAMDYAKLFTAQPLFQTIAPWMLYLYLLIVAYKSIFLVYHWNKFKVNFRHTWIKPSIDLKLFTLVKAYEFGIRRKVSLWYSNAISTPITFGFFKPVILMPVALLNQLTLEEAETLIVHELTHIKNNDYLLNFILIVSDTLFFFNPFIKIIAGRIRLEREKNCDVQVLHFKYSSLTYAETLLKAARFKPKSRAFQLAAVSRNKQLLNRILFFTSENNLKFRKNNYNALTYLLILVVLCINLFTITEIKRDRTQSNFAYIPTMTPGYNADEVYSFFTDKALAVAAPQVEKIMNAIENGGPALENDLKKLIPSDKHLELLAAKALEEVQVDEENYAIHAAVTEADDTKELIINEENSLSGKSITKVYKMVFINGQWVAQPMWMFTESKLKKDSIQLMKDSIIKPFHIIQ